jgi:aspartate-semialdehyde dehydrogenase
MKPVVAIMGATGNVGRQMLSILEQRHFPIKELKLLASARSAGRSLVFRGQRHTVEDLTPTSFEGVDLVLASAGASISKQYVDAIVKAGATIVDNSSAFRMDEGVPLVIPEANGQTLEHHQGIIANPNCSTSQLMVALGPIHKKFGLKRLVISTYQSVSGTGKAAIEELIRQSKMMLEGKEVTDADCQTYSHPIAFNVLPQCDIFFDNGYTKEELKLVNETRKILGDEDIAITATAVRVPVMVSHAESVNVETREKTNAAEVRELLKDAPGLIVVDDPEKMAYPTPLYSSGQDETFVGRIRDDISNPNAIEMFVVADNLRKGAALNTIQIAEVLLENDWLKVRPKVAV